MSDHPNVARMREGYDAFAKGDLAALRELMTEDIVWHLPGHSALAGDYEGPTPSSHSSAGPWSSPVAPSRSSP
jgi:ketosteroid isomerase-like protein